MLASNADRKSAPARVQGGAPAATPKAPQAPPFMFGGQQAASSAASNQCPSALPGTVPLNRLAGQGLAHQGPAFTVEAAQNLAIPRGKTSAASETNLAVEASVQPAQPRIQNNIEAGDFECICGFKGKLKDHKSDSALLAITLSSQSVKIS